MELVLRKRLCFSVVKRHSLAEKLKRKLGQVTDHDHDGRDNESDDDDDDDDESDDDDDDVDKSDDEFSYG